MKNTIGALCIVLILISFSTFGQNKIEYFENGKVNYKIIQLSDTVNAYCHVVQYYANGRKSSEFHEKFLQKCDTFNEWTKEGVLHHREIYTDSGYVEIDYYSETGTILSIGNYKIVHGERDQTIIYDSTNFDKYSPDDECSFIRNCYERTGIWKTYHKNGEIESEGKYLPSQYLISYPMKYDSINDVMVDMPKTSFEFNTSLGVKCSTYLKDSTWSIYNKQGNKIQEKIYKTGLLVDSVFKFLNPKFYSEFDLFTGAFSEEVLDTSEKFSQFFIFQDSVSTNNTSSFVLQNSLIISHFKSYFSSSLNTQVFIEYKKPCCGYQDIIYNIHLDSVWYSVLTYDEDSTRVMSLMKTTLESQVEYNLGYYSKSFSSDLDSLILNFDTTDVIWRSDFFITNKKGRLVKRTYDAEVSYYYEKHPRKSFFWFLRDGSFYLNEISEKKYNRLEPISGWSLLRIK